MRNKNWTSKTIALAIVCFLVGAGIGLLGYHYFLKPEATPSNWQSTKVQPIKEMVQEIVFYEKGRKEVIDLKSEEGIRLASLLTRKLCEVNLQARCVFSEEDAHESIISVNSSVFEGERWMVIFSDGKVTCYSDHYYPDYKEIVIKEGYIPKEEVNALLELFSNLSEYSEYTVNVSEQLIRDHMDCVFVPFGDAKISCIPLNKTLELRLRSSSFPEPETVTPVAKEIMERIDKVYREAEVTERRKENNPSKIPGFEAVFAIAGLSAVAYLLRRWK